MPESKQLKVFLCHSSNDKPAVRELYQKLCAEPWIDPWLDEEKLYPGQNWQNEIPRAVRDSDVVLVCLSDTSVNKEGYVQKELRFALDVALEKPEDAIFIIPVRLEECKTPSSLAQLHYVDYFPAERRSRAFERLLVSLKMRVESLGAPVVRSGLLQARVKSGAPGENSSARLPILAGGKKQVHGEALFDSLTLGMMEFCRIPAGKFTMGSNDDDSGADRNEKPEHILEIPYDYWLARFPVTNARYSPFVKAGNMEHPVLDWEKKPAHPVVIVSWDDAQAFIKWLNATQSAGLPNGYIFRLPTEAEWEKAARGANGNIYPWGNNFDARYCNSVEAKKGTTVPVRMYSPSGDSPYGCADMCGNVWEWTHTLFAKYPYKVDDGRENELESGPRVMRGGAFNCDQRLVRCSARFRSPTDFCRDSLGFRVCLAPPLKG